MTYKLLGAILVITGCGGFGIKLIIMHTNEERTLRQLISALDYMACELQYRLTPLPILIRQTAAECTGILSDVFLKLAYELENQISPDVNTCMTAAIAQCGTLPLHTNAALRSLGKSLGKFDINGQLMGLEAVRQSCRQSLESLCENRSVRLRGYQTLALCAGAALVILFI